MGTASRPEISATAESTHGTASRPAGLRSVPQQRAHMGTASRPLVLRSVPQQRAHMAQPLVLRSVPRQKAHMAQPLVPLV